MSIKRIRNRIARKIAYPESIRSAVAERGFANCLEIFTYTAQSELETLFQLAESLPVGANIVEIGSYLGASTAYLAAGGKPRGVKITCIDTWNNDAMVVEASRDTWQEFRFNLAAAWDVLTAIRKKSDEVQSCDLPVSIDLAFIDGDHSYESVKVDFSLIARQLGATGLVAFHDVGSHSGVTRFVGELIQTCEWIVVGHVNTLMWLRRASVRMH